MSKVRDRHADRLKARRTLIRRVRCTEGRMIGERERERERERDTMKPTEYPAAHVYHYCIDSSLYYGSILERVATRGFYRVPCDVVTKGPLTMNTVSFREVKENKKKLDTLL